MKHLLVLALAVVAATLLAAAPAAARPAGLASASVLAERTASVPHGVAGDRRFVFLSELGVPAGSGPARVVVLDRRTGRQVAEVPAPPGGFAFPFALRVPRPGHLVVLDNAGFPPSGAPTVYDFRYDPGARVPAARLERTVSFAGLPALFAEDVEVLPDGEYVVSEGVVGAFWIVGRDGRVRPGLVPEGAEPLDRIGPCQLPAGPFRVGSLPFAPPGGFAPGAGTMARRGGWLYFGQSCRGGLHRVRVSTLRDASRPAAERVREVQTVSPKPAGRAIEVLHGLAVDPSKPRDPWVYAGDPFALRLVRVHARTGRRQVVSSDARLFHFAVTAAFLPPRAPGRPAPLVTVGDQEHRWTGLNAALRADAFRRPFLVTRTVPRG